LRGEEIIEEVEKEVESEAATPPEDLIKRIDMMASSMPVADD
jgi:hypothetical protein